MNQNLTDITVVVDRSGSMQSCRSDAEGGLNSFIDKQKEEPGEALFTLVQFNTTYEFLHKGVPIKDVPKYNLHPAGMTALLDAVGRAMDETGLRLKGMREEDRPGLVVFVIVTDGAENSSKEYTLEQIKTMIERQQRDYKWEFTFLGANQDAFATGSAMGMNPKDVADYSPNKMQQAYAAVGGKVASMRAAASAGLNTSRPFTDEERKGMK
jgi:hypothetical protein